MVSGYNGTEMAKWKSRGNTTVGKNRVNGPCGMIPGFIKNRVYSILVKLMVYTNIGTQMDICIGKNTIKKAFPMENGPIGMNMTAT